MKRAIPDKAAKVKQAGERALQEARAREESRCKKAKSPAQPALSKELGGRDGPEPTRFGDWERKGIATDF